MKYSDNIGNQLAKLANDYIKANNLVWAVDEIPVKAVFKGGDNAQITFFNAKYNEPSAWNIVGWILIGKGLDGDVYLRSHGTYPYERFESNEDLYYQIRLIGLHRKGFRP